jgi:hypothetical protein
MTLRTAADENGTLDAIKRAITAIMRVVPLIVDIDKV